MRHGNALQAWQVAKNAKPLNKHHKYWNGLLYLMLVYNEDLQDKIEFCLQQGIVVDWCRLWRAALSWKNMPMVDVLLKFTKSMPASSQFCRVTLLYFCIEQLSKQQQDIIKCIQASIDEVKKAINMKCENGRTPLMIAESVEVAQLLIDLGANVNTVTPKNYSVLYEHVLANRTDIALLLLKHGARVTPWCVVIAEYDANLFAMMTNNLTNGQWKSVLQHAIEYGSKFVVNEALKRGAHISDVSVLYFLRNTTKGDVPALWKFSTEFLWENFPLACVNQQVRELANIQATDCDKQGHSALSYIVKARNAAVPDNSLVPQFYNLLETCGIHGALFVLRSAYEFPIPRPLVFRIDRLCPQMKVYRDYISKFVIFSAQRKPYLMVCYATSTRTHSMVVKYVSKQLPCAVEKYYPGFLGAFRMKQCYILVPQLRIAVKQYYDVKFQFAN